MQHTQHGCIFVLASSCSSENLSASSRHSVARGKAARSVEVLLSTRQMAVGKSPFRAATDNRNLRLAPLLVVVQAPVCLKSWAAGFGRMPLTLRRLHSN